MMQVKDMEVWKAFCAAHTDQYESGILGFASRWADRMEVCLDEAGVTVGDIAEGTIDHDERGLRLTNSQLAAAIVALVKFWEHGEALEAWRKENWAAVKARRNG